jgi:hypothetical protein
MALNDSRSHSRGTYLFFSTKAPTPLRLSPNARMRSLHISLLTTTISFSLLLLSLSLFLYFSLFLSLSFSIFHYLLSLSLLRYFSLFLSLSLSLTSPPPSFYCSLPISFLSTSLISLSFSLSLLSLSVSLTFLVSLSLFFSLSLSLSLSVCLSHFLSLSRGLIKFHKQRERTRCSNLTNYCKSIPDISHLSLIRFHVSHRSCRRATGFRRRPSRGRDPHRGTLVGNGWKGEKEAGTGFTNISTIFLSFFYLFSNLLLNCF